jgi:predicted alpha/beta-hydrolase family hydrolase
VTRPAPELRVETPHGPARVRVEPRAGSRATLVLGHGAGGGVDAPDLHAAARAAHAEGFSVAFVEQPYRVAGRRSPVPAAQLDASWIAVVAHLRAEVLGDAPLVTGGRSSGARVACRTAAATNAAGVLCLAFPLRPPGRDVSRLDELKQVTVPTLIVQGRSDPFGMPRSSGERKVVRVPGDHSLRQGLKELEAAVGSWLRDL